MGFKVLDIPLLYSWWERIMILAVLESRKMSDDDQSSALLNIPTPCYFEFLSLHQISYSDNGHLKDLDPFGLAHRIHVLLMLEIHIQTLQAKLENKVLRPNDITNNSWLLSWILGG